MKPFNMTNNKQVIIIIGPPGSGKGTQASLLSDKLGFYYLETSKIIERKIMSAKEGEVEIVDGQEYSFTEEKRKWETGELNSLPLVSFWVKQRIQELAQEGESIIFAGSPRSLLEAKQITPLIEELYGKDNIKIVLFELEAKESIWRNTHRRICELIRHPVLFNKETEKLTMCPLDGSKLLKREKLDNPEIIKKRLEVYKEETLPVIDYFKQRGLNVSVVDASPAPAEIFKKVLNLV